jgi:23S rRNA pseudouridine1911/1915/1917 synthase
VLFEDNHVLGVAKPAGLPSQGGRGIDVHLVSLVEAYRREAEAKPGRAFVGLVHRLDRNVSGAMVLAKTSKAASRLAGSFRAGGRGLRKVYVAWVRGVVAAEDGVIRSTLVRADGVTREAPGGREASLAWAVDGRGSDATRLVVTLGTGRTHQIRAQLASIGHPIVNDAKYGGGRGRRPALHARLLSVPHPVTGASIDLVAPIPPDLERLDAGLGCVPPVA